jgi:NADH dehydrogenase
MIDDSMDRLVVLGGGYAGLRAALDLAPVVRARPSVKLLLIDRSESHQFITRLHEVAAEALPASEAAQPFERLLPRNVGFVQAEVTAIDLRRCRVHTSRGEHGYRHLVVALGSETALPPLPGLRQYGLRLRYLQDAVAIRQHIRECFRQASQAGGAVQRRAWLRIVVAGGGYTGCQMAGELAHWLPDLADEHHVPISDIHLMLLEAADRLLPGGPPADSRRAEEVLSRKGIHIHLNTRLEGVEPDTVRFGPETWHCRTLIWCGGIAGPPLLREAGLLCDPQGRVKVDQYLRAQGYPEVFVVGDAARVTAGERVLPASAALALRQGVWVAEALAAMLRRREPTPYEPVDTGLVVSLGGQDAAGDLLGLPVDGFPAWLAKSGIEVWYRWTSRSLAPVFRL